MDRPADRPESKRRTTVRSLALFGALAVLALAASATSLGNGFTFDDSHIVEHNPRVHTLGDPVDFFVNSYWPRELGGSLYRPLTILRFALQWVAGGGSPFVFHAVNVALYVALTLVVFAIARRLLPLGAAFLAAALFAVHPVHVDAVANVVGQSELVVALCAAGGVLWYLHMRRRPELRLDEALGLFALTIAGSLSKENGVLLPVLVGVAELTVVRDPRPWRARLRSLLPAGILLGVALGLVLLVRRGALDVMVGEHPVYALTGLTAAERGMTVLRLVLEWLRLLVWPAHLQAEYGPPALDAAHRFGAAQAAGLLVIVATVVAAVAARRKASALTFGLAWTAIAILPVSNLFVITGILVAERTLFLASVGAVIAAAAAANLIWDRIADARPLRSAALAATSAVILLGCGWSARRQLVWRTNETLFAQGIKDAPESYRSWYQYGRFLAAEQRAPEAQRMLERAAVLYQRDGGVFEDLGQVVRMQAGCRPAIPIFERAIAAEPYLKDARGRLYACLLSTGDTARALAVADEGAKLGQWYFQLVMVMRKTKAEAPADPAAR
jgi:hypothetical protein